MRFVSFRFRQAVFGWGLDNMDAGVRAILQSNESGHKDVHSTQVRFLDYRSLISCNCIQMNVRSQESDKQVE